MDNLWTYIAFILLGGVVIAVLIWAIGKFLPWVLLLRKGVLVEGRIEAHHNREITGGEDTVTYLSLVYSYDCNGENYLHEEVVDSDTYSELKDGDRVKVHCLLGNPTTAELEASAFITLMTRFRNIRGIPVDSHEIYPERWKGD